MSGGASAVTSPQAQIQPRDAATNTFAQMLISSLTQGTNLGELIRQIGQTQGYQGQTSAPVNAGQSNALAAANAAFARQFGMASPGVGNQAGAPGSSAGAPGGAPGGLAGLPGGPPPHNFWDDPGAPSPGGPFGPSIPSNTLNNPGPAFQDPTHVNVGGVDTTVADYLRAINTPGTPEFQAFAPPGYSFYNGAWVNDSSLEMAGLKQPGVPIPVPNSPAGAAGAAGSLNPQTAATMASALSPIASNGLTPGPAQVSAQNQIPVPTGPGPGSNPGIPLPPTGGIPGAPGAGGAGPTIGALPGAGSDANINRIAGQTGLNLPPQIQALLQGSQNTQSGMAGGIQTAASGASPYIDALAGLAGPNGGGGSSSGSNYLMTLLQSPQAQSLLSGGQGANLNQIGSAISAAAQPGLDRNVRDLREQFSTAGLRDSTDLNMGVSDLMARNQSQITGQLAQIAPQIAQNANSTSLGALSSLGGIGQGLGSLGQGDLSARIAALTGAASTGTQAQGNQLSALNSLLGTTTSGNNNTLNSLAGIFGNQQNNQTSAALAQPGAASTVAQLPGQLAAQNYGLNAQSQTLDQSALDRNMQVWLQSQGLTPQILSFLGTTPATQYGPSALTQGTNAIGTGLAAYGAAKGAK